MNIHSSIVSLVGNTPLLELGRYSALYDLATPLVAKVEAFNPTGSVKDRAALFMIADAERRGTLKPGSVIIEPTSGNTGIGLAAIAAARGYRVILTMPETMSIERRKMLQVYGAELVLTEGALGMKGAIAKAEELARDIPGSLLPGQFTNSANPAAHFETTGPEIWRDTDGRVDVFVSGVGTGGTLSGTGKYLKGKNPSVSIVAVEPSASPVLSGGKPGPHAIQGIGAGFVPQTLDSAVFDEIVQVDNDDALTTAREIAATEGLLAGISSGAAVWAARSIAMRPGNENRRIVVLLPDSGDRYLSVLGE